MNRLTIKMLLFNRNLNFVTTLFSFIFFTSTVLRCNGDCNIPVILRGTWYSWEGKSVSTVLDATTMTGRGSCVAIKEEHHVNYTILFKKDKCYTCVKLLVRSINVLESVASYGGASCLNVPNEMASLDYVCSGLNQNQHLITLFSENYIPVNCRSSLEGVWNFAYQDGSKFTGECNHPDSHIRSCQQTGSQFLITNQKFNITYKKCPGMTGTFDGVVEYSCLGDWFVDKNHFFAVANTKESRKDKKYRCFLRNRDNDLYIGISNTAECDTLKTIAKSPKILHITPVKLEIIEPGCRLSKNLSGEWINTANIDADIFINETHIIETWSSDEGRNGKTNYICKEQQGTRVMMARLTVDGCQKQYVCYDFLPQHHNVIRYRRGKPLITDNFDTVCAWEQFPSKAKWKYDLYIKKNPTPVRCPVAGRFNFTQKGDILFETRISGGITLSPRPGISCKQNISDFSVCDKDQKEIVIDANYCLAVDYRGRPVYIYNEPDYKIQCIAYWKENITSYLITYNRFDPVSKYSCWVYERAHSNRVLMSQALGSFCDVRQDAYSSSYTEGAAVHIDLQEYQRENDDCPMHFDDDLNSQPRCSFPKAFSGNWSADIDADIFINETHIVETSYSDEERHRKTIYVCNEQQDTRIMVATLSIDESQMQYVCYDFLLPHHNIIRYRRGKPLITDNFDTVCAWEQFPNRAKWKYDLYIRKTPTPVRCPVAGRFNFTQKGDVLFETRISGGITLSPRPGISCKQNISDFSVCDKDQKEIVIDANYCLAVDYRGRPVYIYNEPDYKIQCIAYWKENITSYLITYNRFDPVSKYSCWVYERAHSNRVLMSQSLGSFCDVSQDAYSSNYTEGAAVHIDLQEYKRGNDDCPMHFDDGSHPWLETENTRNISLTL